MPRPAHHNRYKFNKYSLLADWRPVEERLPAEGDSLGDLLAQFTGYVSPALLNEVGWRPVLAAAKRWPATCAALPFGFEFQLRDPRPRADFGITLAAGGKTAEWVIRSGREQGAPSFKGRLARLLSGLGAGGTVLKREVGRIMIEIDIASAATPKTPDPGVFLYFRGASDGAPRETDAVLAALNAAVGRTGDPAEFHLAQNFGRAIPAGVAFISLGVIPGRSRGFRLTAYGFDDGARAEAFLRRVGWKGRYDVLAGTIARLEALHAFGRLGLMLYARGGNFESKLGLYLRHVPRAMPALLDGLAAEGCVPEKLAGLHPEEMQPVVLWGKAGEYTLLREFTHAKLVLTESGFEDIKAYSGLVCA